jgi:prepilin-type N-terminal cleavage/methylation domain-containing protein/prepilin-type processing-associated H-X9-DG protein
MSVAHRSFSVRVLRAFTLVELLVVIAIIGVLMSLTLPAIQGARETARTTECMNKMKQMATATASYKGAWNQYPNGGWGPTWVGMPPYQMEKQPGGWIYQLLPYTEENNLATERNPTLNDANAKRAKAVIPWLYCPTRRSATAIPYSNGAITDCTTVTEAGRTDYAACSGNNATGCEDQGKFPTSISSAATSTASTWLDPTTLNGAIMQRRGLRDNDFVDGLGKTYLYGEKAMDQSQIDTGNWNGDKAPALSGFGNSIIRTTAKPPTSDAIGLVMDCRFGSAHPGGANFAFADMTVRMQDFGIDPTVYSQLGHRNDKGPTNEGDYIK